MRAGGRLASTSVAKGESKPIRLAVSLLEVFAVALRLGFTSFGGPVAHLGYFRDEYVARRQWLDDKAYADLVALCQFLPGPASSQVGIAIGMTRAGFVGGIASWLGFTLPSALGLIAFASFLHGVQWGDAGWLGGLLIAAVAVVAHAVWGMAARLAPDRERATIAIVTAVIALAVPTAGTQVILIMLGGLLGWWLLERPIVSPGHRPVAVPVSRRAAVVCWGLFGGLLVALPLLRQAYAVEWIAVLDSMYRAGSLVFGGGHVVLPLLQAEFVTPGWLVGEQFMAGYGAAQAVPGPLFTFAAYVGAIMGGWQMAALTTVGVFLPSFLLVAGALPFWESIRHRLGFRAAFSGINAAVVGILLAAFYEPVWTKAIHSPLDFALALVAFGLLMYWKVPAWLVVIVSALGGAALAAV